MSTSNVGLLLEFSLMLGSCPSATHSQMNLLIRELNSTLISPLDDEELKTRVLYHMVPRVRYKINYHTVSIGMPDDPHYQELYAYEILQEMDVKINFVSVPKEL